MGGILVPKIYSAFVSSNYNSLIEKRRTVINSLLSANMLPVAMENFTVTNFRNIELLIDKSDIVIILLGCEYGSEYRDGISYTEAEYNYAHDNNKKIVGISTESYVSLEKKDVEILTEEEKKQINFAKKIKTEHMLVCENDKSIETIISEISHSPDLNKLQGWIRDISNEEWKSTHKIFDLHGRWFHVLYNIDIDYIRYGYIDIEQNFNDCSYSVLMVYGNNFSIKGYSADNDNNHFRLNKDKHTTWDGTFFLDEKCRINGMYKAHRTFDENFGQKKADKGEYIGVQSLHICDNDNDNDLSDEATEIRGEFSDIIPSPKYGKVAIFRSSKERDDFIVDELYNLLEKKGLIKNDK